jgi:hypothetical protein
VWQGTHAFSVHNIIVVVFFLVRSRRSRSEIKLRVGLNGDAVRLTDGTRSFSRIVGELGGAVHDGASLDDGGRREGGGRGLGGEERGREGINNWRRGGGGRRRGRGHGNVREVERNGARDGVGKRRSIVLYGEGVVHGGGVGGNKEENYDMARGRVWGQLSSQRLIGLF